MNLFSQSIPASRFIASVTLLNILLFHLPLYQYAVKNIEVFSANGVATLITLFVVVYVTTAFLLSLLCIAFPFLLKPFCIIVSLLNASALYFMVNYKVVFDRTMMANIFNTRSEESLVFLNFSLLMYITFLGLLPAWVLIKVRITPVARYRLFVHSFSMIGLGLVFIYINSSTWLWFDKHAKLLGGSILPWSYTFNTVRNSIKENKQQKRFDLLPAAVVPVDKKTLVVLVIGETARSANFSLYGYDRLTNPSLNNEDVAVLRGTKSCSTYTTASLHCMLSHNGKKSGSDELLPSYLHRYGIDVVWRTNNWGEDPLTVDTYDKASKLRRSCLGDYCSYDDVLLYDLEKRINLSDKNNIFVVLHTKGSHGPAYYTRYPEVFNVFQPVCRSVELNNCDEQSLVNAYDNSILYTDDFLFRTIQLLKNTTERPATMIYVSDHGESLGEYGLYLHGTPYSIAPNVQKDIPFIVWMSDSFKARDSLDSKDVQSADTYSHDHIFHSVLGAFDIESGIYNASFDIFSTGP